MADDPKTLPLPPQYATAQQITNLTHALRSQTNAILEQKIEIHEVKATLAIIAERLDHLVHDEREEAIDIRAIFRAVVDTGKDATEAKHAAQKAEHAAKETRKDVTGPIALHTPEQLEALKRPGAIEALGVLVERLGKLPTLVKWILGTSVGGAIVEAAHRFFHF